MVNRATSNFLRWLFRFGLIIKLIDGVLEATGGILLFFVKQETLSRLVIVLTQHELAENPAESAANHLRAFVGHLSRDAQFFAAAYLLIHGLVKVVLALSVLRGRPWVYPWAMSFFLIFMACEGYRLSCSHSPVLAGFFSLDLMIVALLRWEHGRKFDTAFSSG